MRFRKELIFIVLATLVTLTVGARIGLSATSCADIKNLSFTDLEFGKPITITSATIIAATATTPELCDVRGTIWPEIQFALKIPTTTWNERFMMVGTGGTAGMIFESSMPPYLKLGFAAVGTDTGHTAPSPGQGELWAIPSTTNPNADQKVKDYGYRANHEVPVLAKKIIEAYRGIKPRYSYWVGCSNGGREGLVSAQRYPTDFDGYLANSPPVNLARSMIGFIWKGIKFPNVSVSKLCLQSQYVFNKCDGLDGLVDGLIENPAACAFDPLSDLPSCPNDVDAANCFTLKQRTAIKDIYGGPKTSWGAQINVPLQPGAEVCTDPSNPATSGWGRMATTINTGSSTIGYLILRDPGFDATKFSFDTDTFEVLDRPETEWMAADNPDLWRVKNRGGKMISVYGWAESQDPYVSLKYYNAVIDFMGWETVNEFYKLYFVPGMFHCGGGVGCSTVDFFTPLQNWVENGVVPKAVIGSRSATATLTARTRPICPYPEVARYKGSGSIDDAANFACVKPEVIAACDDIKKLSFTDIAFNKPVTITSTTIVTTSATTPQYCDVRGTIWPEINFALKIPTTTWNERLMMVGSGGTAGSISEFSMPPYLQKGFAVVATDTGHKATPPGEPWALPGLTNPNADQKIKDYGYRANHEVSNLAKKIIKAYQGSNPRYSYWTGCSNGGREALVEAQRYPEDFDGILAGCGPSFFPGRMMGFIWNYNVWGPKVPTSKLCLQSKYVYDKCDGLDGLVDGLIENPLACEFDPMTELPGCPNDVDGSDCWTIDQRTAIKMIYQGPTTSKGQEITIGGFTLPGMPLGSEACTNPSSPATSGWMMYIARVLLSMEMFLST